MTISPAQQHPLRWLVALICAAAVALSFSITAAQGLLIVLIVAMAVLAAQGRVRLVDFPLWPVLLGYVAVLTLTIFFSPRVLASLDSIRTQWILLFMPALMLLVPEGKRATVSRWLMIGAVAVSAYVLAQITILGEHPRGLFSHHLTLGGVLSQLCVWGAALAIWAPDAAVRRQHALLAAIAFLGLALTPARGPILFTFLCLGAMLILRFSWRGVAAAALAAVIMAALVASAPPMRAKIQELADADFSRSDTSIGTRLMLWRTALEMFADNPVTGVGLRNWTREVDARVTEPILARSHAHNIYLQHLAAAGLLGLGALVWFIVSQTRTLAAPARGHDPWRRAWARAGLAAMAVFYLGGLTENVLGDSEVAMVQFFLVGLALPRA